MYLKKSTSSKTGRTQLSIVHGFRDSQGRTRQKTIMSLGYLDELEKEYENPIAHFEQVAKQMDQARKEENSTISFSISSLPRAGARLFHQQPQALHRCPVQSQRDFQDAGLFSPSCSRLKETIV
jgi:hypothetical protein